MRLHRLIAAVPMILALLAPANAAGQVPAAVPLPADLQGELDGIPYRIRVPANWNGTLIVYAHGYGEAALPLALAPLPADVDALLAKGFALAASRFGGAVPVPPQAVAGYQVKQGMQNSVALTGAFREVVGRPLRTIIWGKSLGGLIALGLIELLRGGVVVIVAEIGTDHEACLLSAPEDLEHFTGGLRFAFADEQRDKGKFAEDGLQEGQVHFQ